MNKSIILEKKTIKKIKPYETGEEVWLYLIGQEPRRGTLTSITEWNGELVYEVTFKNDDKKWGSIKQISRVTKE